MELSTLAAIRVSVSIIIRLQFAVENIRLFISSLVQENNQIQTTFNTTIPFEITEIETGKGDSHNNGKSVLRFKLNNLNLIYKYKNLEIGEQFNAFLSYIEDLDSQYSFYKVKRVIGSNFTIEEEVTQSTCHNKDEVEMYYHNYGSLLAITYWLGASDLHMENLIAHQQFPVLVDIETIIATDRTKQNESPQTKQQLIEKKSMISSGLLPLKRYWKRQLEMSALNGTKQKLPFKVRKLVNKKTSEVKLQLEVEYLKGAKNIPLLNNLEVNYQDYTDNIEKGFVEMNDLLLKHKQDLLKMVQRLFNNCTVRHLLRDTQDYANFLSFAHHPSCMVDFIEREKIMENLWEAQYITKNVIPLEIEEMLVNDVPLLETNSRSYWIKNSSKQLRNCLKKNSMALLAEHILGMNKDTLFQSLLFLRESLGTLTYELKKIDIPETNTHIEDPFLQKATDIGDLVVSNLKIDPQNQYVYWAESIPNEDGEITLEYPSTNLYNGTSGVFIFLFSLNHFVPKDSYQKILSILEKEVFSDTLAKEDYFSAFYGDGASLAAAFYAYRLSRDVTYLKKMNSYIERLATRDVSIEQDEWIYGKASLLALLVSIYQTEPLPKTLTLIEKIAKSVKENEADDIGFAHGQAGIIYALHQANQLLVNDNISKKEEKLVISFTRLLDSNNNLNDSWCKGTTGINYTLNTLHLDKLNFSNQSGSDSSICHGSYLNYKQNIFFKCHKGLLNSGLFNGVSGIGYFYLLNYQPKTIINILFMEK